MSSLRVKIASPPRAMIPRRGIHSSQIRRLRDAPKPPAPKPPAAAPSESRAVHAMLTQALLRIGELAGKIEHNEEAFKRMAEQQDRQQKDIFEAWAQIKEVRKLNLELEFNVKSIRDQRHQQQKKEEEKGEEEKTKKRSSDSFEKFTWEPSVFILGSLLIVVGPNLVELWQVRAREQAENTNDQTLAASQEAVPSKVLKSPKEIEVQELLEPKQPEERAESTADKDPGQQRCGKCRACCLRELLFPDSTGAAAFEIQPVSETSGDEDLGADYQQREELVLKALPSELETQKVADPLFSGDAMEGEDEETMGELVTTVDLTSGRRLAGTLAVDLALVGLCYYIFTRP